MGDSSAAPVAVLAYYHKEHISTLKVKLQNFKDCLHTCTVPHRRAWLESRINELEMVLHERTGMWY